MSIPSQEQVFDPVAGTLVTVPYIDEKSTLKKSKEVSGDAQMSKVIAIGQNLIDNYGNLRKPQCKVGDIIVHSHIIDSREIRFSEYRFVFFHEVRSIYNES